MWVYCCNFIADIQNSEFQTDFFLANKIQGLTHLDQGSNPRLQVLLFKQSLLIVSRNPASSLLQGPICGECLPTHCNRKKYHVLNMALCIQVLCIVATVPLKGASLTSPLNHFKSSLPLHFLGILLPSSLKLRTTSWTNFILCWSKSIPLLKLSCLPLSLPKNIAQAVLFGFCAKSLLAVQWSHEGINLTAHYSSQQRERKKTRGRKSRTNREGGGKAEGQEKKTAAESTRSQVVLPRD